MLLVALIAPPADPSIPARLYGGILGRGWAVRGFGAQDDVPDEVAAEMEFLAAGSPAVVNARLLRRAPKLKLIQVIGHGYEHVNLDDARAAGVPVATIASSGAEAHIVAEMTILLAGAACRAILEGDAATRRREWGQVTMLERGIVEMAGKTFGIIGLGAIGREVAKRARGFDMQVVYHDRERVDRGLEAKLGVEFRNFEALLAESDFVSLHVPLTAENERLIDARALALMKPNAVLINTARGQLVDGAAVATALHAGRLGAAAIDVFDAEPPHASDPLLHARRCVLSPHMAGVTAESLDRILRAALENCQRVARGEAPRDVITPPEP